MNMIDTKQAELPGLKGRPFLANLGIRLIKEKPLGLAGAIIFLILLIVGLSADLLAPYGYNEMDFANPLAPPSASHLLGTDNLGRDELSRIIFGARISIVIGLAATLLSTFISLILGIVSGFFGGVVDLVIQRFVDAWMCFPGFVLLLAVLSIVGAGMWQVIFVLGILSGVGVSRIMRGAVIAVKGNMYFVAATAIGVPISRILYRHILPNIMAPIIVMASTGIAGMILAEASLSFLGFGIVGGIPSWGGMLNGASLTYMIRAPWMALWPGIALTVTVYGINIFGDAIRDLLDPRLRGSVGNFGRLRYKNLPRETSPKVNK